MAIIDVKSEVTGTVWKLEVAVGANAEEDDTLVLVESMKMEIPIGAPDDGAVVELCVAEGDAVADGQVVARIEGSAKG
jgi:acetyl-CoA carboxylase biotin carboxyl carrier protein